MTKPKIDFEIMETARKFRNIQKPFSVRFMERLTDPRLESLSILDKMKRHDGRRKELQRQNRESLSFSCPMCKAHEGSMCVTVGGRFPGREQYASHAARRRQLWEGTKQ